MFCQEHGLKIANSLFKARKGRMWTWMSSDGVTRNQIDYIVGNKLNTMKNFKVLSKFGIHSDHRPVVACISTGKILRKRPIMNKQIDYIPQYKHKEMIEEISFEKTNFTPQEMYDKLENTLQNIQNELKTLHKKSSSILSLQTRQIISQRDKLKWKVKKTEEERNNFSKIQKRARQMIRKDINDYTNKMIEQIMGTSGSIKDIEKKKSLGKDMIPTLEDNKGTNTTTRKEILNIATMFYRKLYDSEETIKNIASETKEQTLPFLKSEIRNAISNLKNKKATGSDKITNETLKCYMEELIEPIQVIFNNILTTGKIPKQWNVSTITLLHKKGSRRDINQYRPITLSSCLYKLFMTLLKNRIHKKIEENQPVDQAGFRKGFSTTDHLHSLNMIIEKYTEWKKPLYICFIDFTKAFDSISHEYLQRSLLQQGIETKYIQLLGEIYSNGSARIKLESEGPIFPLKRGVKQGDPVSPILFNCLLEETFRAVDWTKKGILINGYRMTALRFADDIVFLAETSHELQNTISEFQLALTESGLQLNETKTKIMTNYTQIPVIANGKQLEYVEDYVYLGQVISFQNRLDKEIDRRVNMGWKKYWSLKYIFKSNLHISIKRKVFNMCVLPTMTYGAQTWSTTKKQRTKLLVNQRAMERSMLGIKLKDRIENEVIRHQTKIQDIITTIDKLKWQWAGHVMRIKDQRWTKLTTEWIPRDGRRGVGRPLMRWSDELRAFHPLWWRFAHNRAAWNKMAKIFIAQNRCKMINHPDKPGQPG
ncbi:hypothetical protein JYU34_002422 [Plutella xylostella]|uniref:Reverse transcriptase domain-containing protein n=1 Tax=Plutella xylostella TaxID=51655 RepID=A0ABQ7R247_PLUXY|nr:hypothetical protein JYU34_002422 [Plutella xylostella]